MEKPVNPNYCATIVKLPETRIKLQNLDNIVGVNIFGYQVLVSKDTPNGLGIFFPAEAQLSDKYCYENNLYRHADKNISPDEKGYFEDNRRIKAMKFKGNTSTGLFMPLSSLKFTGIDPLFLKEGDEFDEINGFEICRKYVVEGKGQKAQQLVDRGFVRADKKFFPEHIDTENFYKNHDLVDGQELVVVTQKLHGTSIRIANTLVNRKLSLWERFSQFFGAKIAQTEYAMLYGSRKVIKDANNPNQIHFYESDIWTNEGKKLDGILPQNYIVYAELIGYTPDGKEIQRNYTYNVPVGQCEMYIYRIATINGQGHMTDLSWKQVKHFCRQNGLKYVPELVRGIKMEDLTKDDFAGMKKFVDTRYFEGDFRNAVYLGDNKDIVDEGVCVRADGLIPKIFKAKSPKFLQHETNLLDANVEDLESSQNI